jgi:YesN/AraC family two-component response regulator
MTTNIQFEARCMGKILEVVIVDDEAMITDLIESYVRFASRKSNIHTFNDSVAAKDYIAHNEIDVLITDYKMPHVDGLQLLAATSPSTTRVMISGYVSEIAEEKLQQLKAIFFEKPVPMKKLGKILHEREAAAA